MPQLLTIIGLFAFFLLIGYAKREYLIGLCLLFAPAYVLRLEINPFPLLGRLPTTLLEILLLALFVLSLPRCMATIKPAHLARTIKQPEVLLPLALLSIASLQLWVSPDRLAALGIFRAYFLEPILFYLIIKEECSQPQTYRLIRIALLGSMLWVSLLGIAQYLFGFGLQEAVTGSDRSRILSIFNTPNALGLYLGPLIAYFLPSLLSTRPGRPQQSTLPAHEAAFSWTAAGVSLLAVVLSLSRGAWLGLVAAGVVCMLIMHGKKAILPLLVSLTLCIVALLLFVPRFQNFFTPTGNPRDLFGDNSANVRVAIWQRTVHMLGDAPLTGAGLAGFQTVYARYDVPGHEEIPLYPHNIFLNLWSELGLTGLLLFTVLIAYFACRSWMIWKTNAQKEPERTTLGFLLFITALVVHGLLDVPYFKNDLSLIFWTIFGIQTSIFRMQAPAGNSSTRL